MLSTPLISTLLVQRPSLVPNIGPSAKLESRRPADNVLLSRVIRMRTGPDSLPLGCWSWMHAVLSHASLSADTTPSPGRTVLRRAFTRQLCADTACQQLNSTGVNRCELSCCKYHRLWVRKPQAYYSTSVTYSQTSVRKRLRQAKTCRSQVWGRNGSLRSLGCSPLEVERLSVDADRWLWDIF